MLIRISLIVAIIAGLAVGALNFVKVKEQITKLQTDLASQTERANTAEAARDKNKRDLDKTTATLNQTKEQLTAATTERDRAVTERDAAVKRSTQLNEELTKAKTDLGDAQASLEKFRGTGLTPEQILALSKQLKDSDAVNAEQELVIKQKDKIIARTQNELDKYKQGEERIVYLKADLQGKVINADPKWNFVILNIGDDQGAKEGGVLLVSRAAHLVARVRITSVQKDRCVANVIEGPSKLGDPIEGDIVIPAFPES